MEPLVGAKGAICELSVSSKTCRFNPIKQPLACDVYSPSPEELKIYFGYN
jgi:hypothetical protein